MSTSPAVNSPAVVAVERPYPASNGEQQRAIASAALANFSESSSNASPVSEVVRKLPADDGSSDASHRSFRTDSTSPAHRQEEVVQLEEKAGDAQGHEAVLRTPERRVSDLGRVHGGVANQNLESSPRLRSPERSVGQKRTASGLVKSADSQTAFDAGHAGLYAGPQAGPHAGSYAGFHTGLHAGSHAHTGSPAHNGRVESGRVCKSEAPNARALELSSQLKTKLAYAMVKVHNGWEKHSLDQLEHLSQVSTPKTSRSAWRNSYDDNYLTSPGLQTTPNNFSAPFQRPLQYSPHQSPTRASHVHYSPHQSPTRASQLQYSPHSPIRASPLSPPLVASSSGFQAPPLSSGPSLAPAAPIAPGRNHRRTQSARIPPSLTTVPARQGILRMPSQQAEKDALDSLLFMASPSNSNSLKYTDSPAGPSPLRAEFAGVEKRVMFER